MVVVEIEAAPVGIVAVVKHVHKAVHGIFHTLYILVDKLRKRTSREFELVFQLLGVEYVFVHYCNKQVKFEREIINQSGFWQPTGFGYFHLACFFVIHFGEYP